MRPTKLDILNFVRVILYVHDRECSGSVVDSRPSDHVFEPHRRQCVVSLSKTHKS